MLKNLVKESTGIKENVATYDYKYFLGPWDGPGTTGRAGCSEMTNLQPVLQESRPAWWCALSSHLTKDRPHLSGN